MKVIIAPLEGLFFKDNINLVILSIIFFTLCIIWRKSYRYRKHRRKQISASKVIEKINSIDNFPQKIGYLRKIDPFVFEELLLSAFSSQGYKIKRNKKYTGDGGIDGVFYVGERKVLVQAKRYKGFVSTQHIKDIENIAKIRNCYAVFCHTGKTHRCTLDLYRNHDRLIIISGEKLIDLISNHQSISDLINRRYKLEL